MALGIEELYRVQTEGYEALMAAKSPMDHPYGWSADNERCRAWIAGYSMARTDVAREVSGGFSPS